VVSVVLDDTDVDALYVRWIEILGMGPITGSNDTKH